MIMEMEMEMEMEIEIEKYLVLIIDDKPNSKGEGGYVNINAVKTVIMIQMMNNYSYFYVSRHVWLIYAMIL